ncbi:MAG: 30S ribosomal protein S21 [Bradymonadaceae bacterium]
MARRDELGPIEVDVKDGNVSRALNRLKREIGREGISREMKRRRFYEKPSARKRRKRREAERRRKKEKRRKERRKQKRRQSRGR